MPPEQAPKVNTIQSSVPAQDSAVTVQDEVVGDAPFAGTVDRVTITPEAAVVANDVNNRTFRLINKGQSGAGNTVVASYRSDIAGGSLAAFDEKDLTLSGVAGARTVAEGDVLVMDEIITGTGVAHGGYEVEIDVSRA